MMNNKAANYALVSSNGVRHEITGSIVYAITYADNLIADFADIPYVDIYLRDVHRVRVYSVDAQDAGTPPIMYLSNVNQSLCEPA